VGKGNKVHARYAKKKRKKKIFYLEVKHSDAGQKRKVPAADFVRDQIKWTREQGRACVF